MKNSFFKVFLVLLIGTIVGSSNLNAQCRGFAKKKCKPIVEADGHLFNGQLNSAELFPGDKADIMLTFYKGQNYRLVVSFHEILGDVTYKLMDTDKNVIYNSEGKDKEYLDFNLESTQQLIVSIEVPGSSSQMGNQSKGCTAVLVGYK